MSRDFNCELLALLAVKEVKQDKKTEEEIKNLSSDWRALYLRANPGIITEAYLNYGDNPSEDELYSAETFYSVSVSPRHDLGLIAKYFLG